MSDFKERVLEYASVGQHTMEVMFAQGAEFAPQILIIPEEGKGIIGTISGVYAGGLKEAVAGILSAPEVPIPKTVVVTVDTYAMMARTDSEEEARRMQAEYGGTLAQRFADGDPRVVEAMSVVVITKEGTGHVMQKYRKTASDGIEWDEPEYTEEVQGWDYDSLVAASREASAVTPKVYPVCPICGGFIPNNERPGEYVGAISRRDNETEICSACGTREALEDYERYVRNRETQ